MNLTPILSKNSPRRNIPTNELVGPSTASALSGEQEAVSLKLDTGKVTEESQNQSKDTGKPFTAIAGSRNSICEAKSPTKLKKGKQKSRKPSILTNYPKTG